MKVCPKHSDALVIPHNGGVDTRSCCLRRIRNGDVSDCSLHSTDPAVAKRDPSVERYDTHSTGSLALRKFWCLLCERRKRDVCA